MKTYTAKERDFFLFSNKGTFIQIEPDQYNQPKNGNNKIGPNIHAAQTKKWAITTYMKIRPNIHTVQTKKRVVTTYMHQC